MLPIVFGPISWDLMLLTAMNFPEKPSEEQEEWMRLFLINFIKVLPCPQCAMHGYEYITKNPPDVSSRDNLIRWNVDFHNVVNQRLKKPVFTVEEAVASVTQRAAVRFLARHTQNQALLNQAAPGAANGNNANATSSNETLYFWFMIVLAILAGVFLISLLIVLIQKNQLQKKCQTKES